MWPSVEADYELLEAALWREIRLALQVYGERGLDILHDCNAPDLIFIPWARSARGGRGRLSWVHSALVLQAAYEGLRQVEACMKADDDAAPRAVGAGKSAGAPVVSILVISYNTRNMTLACLRTVIAETRKPYELIVLDNASSDGSVEAIAAEFPDIRLIRSQENLGFAGGNNVAAREARGEYLLLLNPDTLVLRGALDKLLDFALAEPEAGIWGGRTLLGDGALDPGSCWRRLDLWALAMRATGLGSLFRASPVFNAEGYGGWKRDTVRAVDIVTGCLFLIRRQTWDRLGGFDPTFVMYGEEADLCRRAQAIGLRPIITPEAEIVHYAGASEKVRSDKVVRLNRALMTLIRRHFPPRQRPLARWLVLVSPLSRMIALDALALVGAGNTESRAAWREVWRRRSEWRDGYPDRARG